MRAFSLALACGTLVSISAASAQTPSVGSPVMVNPPNNGLFHYQETALAVSRLNPAEFVVAFNMKQFDGEHAQARVYYGISTSAAGPDFSTGGSRGVFPVPLGTCGNVRVHGVDPMVAFSRVTGDLWVGSMAQTDYQIPPTKGSLHLARKPLGSADFDQIGVIAATCTDDYAPDKGLMAVGQRWGEPAGRETMYMTWLNFNPPNCNSHSHLLVGESIYTATSSPGASWNLALTAALPLTDTSHPPPCERWASGVAPVVLKDGRQVVVVTPTLQQPTSLRSTPEVMYRDNPATALWTPPPVAAPQNNGLNHSYNGGVPEQILFVDRNEIPGAFPVPGYAGICADPRVGHEGDVWVVFAGRSNSTGVGNTDLYIAHGAPDGLGRLTFDSSQTLHLTDADLGVPAGTDQIMPWITVDAQGGINILYNEILEPELTPVAPVLAYAKYARIASWAVPLTIAPFLYNLSGPFVAVVPPASVNGHLGDYQMIDSAGCYIYVAYLSTDVGTFNIYVRRIELPNCARPRADIDANNVVDLQDAYLFNTAYASGSPTADVNRDQCVTIQDWTDFQASYICACNP